MADNRGRGAHPSFEFGRFRSSHPVGKLRRAVDRLIGSSSYQIVPMGEIPDGTDIANWGVAKASAVAQIAFTLAAPFLIASLAYNLMLGFINRAMPQLMVAFIGAPAITAGGIFLLFLSAPALLVAWHAHLDQALLRPFGMP